MKLTEKHLKDERITKLIGIVESAAPLRISEELVLALLELKQRRTEDRISEAQLCKPTE
jgi:hypothetical protein